MTLVLQYIRSVVFLLSMYLVMGLLAVVAFIPAMASRRIARTAAKSYCFVTLWLARILVGIKVEVRGTPPRGEVVIAAKHQSFLDILILYAHLDHAQFIMKRELLWTPVFGQFAWRLGTLSVRRGQGSKTMTKMIDDIDRSRIKGSQICIYPQGTRVKPGAHRPYKRGVAALAKHLQQPCVPVALNVGLFWARKSILRTPGTAVVEFLDPLASDMPTGDLMRELETVIEANSDRLMAEAGFEGATD